MLTSLLWTAVCISVFAGLSLLFACNPEQRLLRRGVRQDGLFFLTSILLYGRVTAALLVGALLILFGHDARSVAHIASSGYGPLSRLPLWIQVAAAALTMDFMQYWLHRALHTPALWRYHAIHHSAEHVDCLTSFRIHPLNHLFYSTSVTIGIVLMGFSPEVLILLAPFNVLMGAFVHANLRWDLGPLRVVLANPVFHRWHHTRLMEGRDKNFAPNFPVWDLLFGTFYMPGRLPQSYGADGVPESFVGQLAYPFQRGEAPSAATAEPVA